MFSRQTLRLGTSRLRRTAGREYNPQSNLSACEPNPARISLSIPCEVPASGGKLVASRGTHGYHESLCCVGRWADETAADEAFAEWDELALANLV